MPTSAPVGQIGYFKRFGSRPRSLIAWHPTQVIAPSDRRTVDPSMSCAEMSTLPAKSVLHVVYRLIPTLVLILRIRVPVQRV